MSVSEKKPLLFAHCPRCGETENILWCPNCLRCDGLSKGVDEEDVRVAHCDCGHCISYVNHECGAVVHGQHFYTDPETEAEFSQKQLDKMRKGLQKEEKGSILPGNSWLETVGYLGIGAVVLVLLLMVIVDVFVLSVPKSGEPVSPQALVGEVPSVVLGEDTLRVIDLGSHLSEYGSKRMRFLVGSETTGYSPDNIGLSNIEITESETGSFVVKGELSVREPPSLYLGANVYSETGEYLQDVPFKDVEPNTVYNIRIPVSREAQFLVVRAF